MRCEDRERIRQEMPKRGYRFEPADGAHDQDKWVPPEGSGGLVLSWRHAWELVFARPSFDRSDELGR